MTDINADNKRIQMFNEFLSECDFKTSEKYRRMQQELCNFFRAHNQAFSMGGAAELIVAVAEQLGEVRNE